MITTSKWEPRWLRGKKVPQWAAVVDGKRLTYVDGYGQLQTRLFLRETTALQAAKDAT